MENTLTAAPTERFSIPKAGSLPVFLALAVIFSSADSGSAGVVASTALAAAKAGVALFFFHEFLA